MATFLLSNDPRLTIQVAIALKPHGLDCQPYKSAADLSTATRRAIPEMVLVDLADRRRERIRLLANLRQSFPAAKIPLVVFHPPDIARSVTTFKKLELDLEFTRDNLPPTMAMTMKNLLVRRLEDRPAGQAHPYALEILGRVWRQGLSGNMSLGKQTVQLCEGGLVNPNHLSILERGLMRGGFAFTPETISALGDWYSVGMSLWNAARTLTTDGFYTRNQRKVFTARPNSSRADALPLSDATRQLLSDRRRELSLRRHLSALRLQPKMVEQDLEVLYLLGLYRLTAARTRQTRDAGAHLKNLPPPTQQSDIPGRKPIDDKLKTRLTLKRLKREVDTLASADEWTVLGIQPTDDRALIEQAGARMRKRYQELASEGTNAEMKSLARTLSARVEEACAAVSELVSVYEIYGAPSDPHSREEVAFRKGLEKLRGDDFGLAMRLFSAACDERMQSPRNLAYLGWTTFKHKGVAAHEEALELLQLSESLDRKALTTQFFIAELEVEIGELERAEERLSRLIRRGSAPEDVHTLYRKVRGKLRR